MRNEECFFLDEEAPKSVSGSSWAAPAQELQLEQLWLNRLFLICEVIVCIAFESAEPPQRRRVS